MTELEMFNKKGYLKLKNFLDKDEVHQVLLEAKGVFLRQFIHKKYIKKIRLDDLSEKHFNSLMYRLFDEDINCLMNCGKQVQHLISLHRLALNNKICELLKRVGLKSPLISTRPVLYFNHPSLAKEKVFHKVEAHQDWRSMQGALNSVVIWIPLIDINNELGALEILPESHKQGLRTTKMESGFGMVSLTEEEKDKLISVEVEVGDVLLFSSFLIHQSGENISSNPRWSCHFRYNDLDEKTFITRKYAHAYIYKPIENLITPNFPKISDVL